MVVTGTGKIGFGPACASAPPVCAAAPASANAPVASIVLRSTVTIIFLLFPRFSTTYLDPQHPSGNSAFIKHPQDYWNGGKLPFQIPGSTPR
jgi:hypothetical protein